MPLRVNDRLVADMAARLGAGGVRFTPRQLYYAVCGAVERPEASLGTAQVGCGVLLVLGGVAGAIAFSAFVSPVALIGLVVFGMGLQTRRAERNRPQTRPLMLSYDEFLRDVVEPRRGSGTRGIPGLLDADQLGAVPADRDLAASVPLVVCDRTETAAVLAANRAAAGLTAAVLDEPSSAGRAAGRRVHALHDADPSGCALPLRLLAAGATEVVDIGLRPGQVAGRRVQVIEGAPAIVPPETAGLLTVDETVWLADGRRVELAILAPQDLLRAVAAAVQGDTMAPPGAAPPGVRLAAAPVMAAESEGGRTPA